MREIGLSGSLREARGEGSISLAQPRTHKRRIPLPSHPAFPRGFVRPDHDLVRISDERKTEQQGLFGEFLEPALVRKLRVAEAELVIALRVSIEKRSHAKFLCESTKLTK